MRRYRCFIPLLLMMWLATGFAYWWQADWWYYVGSGPEQWPKFQAPWCEQLVVSAVVGSFIVGLVVVIAARLWGRFR